MHRQLVLGISSNTTWWGKRNLFKGGPTNTCFVYMKTQIQVFALPASDLDWSLVFPIVRVLPITGYSLVDNCVSPVFSQKFTLWNFSKEDFFQN